MNQLIRFAIALITVILFSSFFPADDQDEKMRAYPNPASEYVTLRYLSEEMPVEEITIIDLTGKQVKDLTQDNQQETGALVERADISDLHTGIYFIRLKSGGQTRSVKLVVR